MSTSKITNHKILTSKLPTLKMLTSKV
jgi:hypothetical protein